MAVTFRCKRSGNTVSFSRQEDIDGMRKHEGYVEVKEEAQDKIEPQSPDVKNELLQEILQKAEARKPGRPKKVV